jgi:hypothetical protein
LADAELGAGAGKADRLANEILPMPAHAILKAALWLVAIALIGSYILIAAVHVNDSFQMGWVQGTRVALARYANNGDLFPPLYDGHSYGGTRFMPLPILLHALAARMSREYLISGKLVSYLTTAGLLFLTYRLLRGMRCSAPMSLALTAAVLASVPGLFAALTIQGDALPVISQLGAVGLIAHRPGRSSSLWAAGLSVLGVLSKLSAIWGPLAILVWLVVRDRRELMWFVGSFLILLSASLGALQLLSHGNAWTNFYELTFAGVSNAGSIARSPIRLIGMISDAGPALVALGPFALLGAIISSRGKWGLYYLALLFAVLTLLVILFDAGATQNHVLDVMVLTALGVGALLADDDYPTPWRAMAATSAALALVWSSGIFLVVDLRPDVIGALRSVRGNAPARNPLSREIRPSDRVLSENPYIPVSLGQFPPVVLDAWALLRLERRHPAWVEDLARRIERHEFDEIVLVYDVDFRGWYSTIHFGDIVATAIRTNYRLKNRVGTYYVYVPAPA